MKSCTAPISTTPRPIQSRHGSHPNSCTAMIGPAIGPAAAMAAKCWPKR
jgi:hypothetical protein